MNLTERIAAIGIVPVIKLKDANNAVPLCRALMRGGLPCAEITFRTDAAEESIRRVAQELPDVLVGAGTVLTAEQADRAMAAGAKFIVTPGFNPDVVGHCVEKGYPIFPGCPTTSDVEQAIKYGLKVVKFFPAEAMGGVATIKAMSAPYGGMKFMPTGGVNENNLLDYLAFDKIMCCGGSWMVPGDAVKAKDWDRITALTRSAVDKMLGLELRHIGINSGTPEQALADAKAIAKLMGWPVKEGNSSDFAGAGFECMKKQGRGTHGHIAIGCNSVARAKWHLEQRGYAFDEDSAVIKNGKLTNIYLKGEIAGFAFHLSQK